jgi:hypothetical protein
VYIPFIYADFAPDSGFSAIGYSAEPGAEIFVELFRTEYSKSELRERADN